MQQLIVVKVVKFLIFLSKLTRHFSLLRAYLFSLEHKRTFCFFTKNHIKMMESNATDDGAAAFWFQRRQSQSNKTLKKRDEGKTSVTKTKIRPQRRRKTDDDIATSNVHNVEKRSKKSSKKSSNKGGKKTGAFARQTTTKDGIEVWTRENQNTSTKDSCDNPIKEIRATVTYEDVSPINFWRAVADLDEYAQFVPYVGKHKVLKTRGKLADGSATFYVYGVVTAPVVKNRDYTIRIETKNNRKKGFESRWTLDTENVGPKPKKGVVRLLANDGGWTIQPSKKNREGSLTANGVSVTYEILTDPGSNIPGWLIDKVNRASVPDVLRAMRKRALSGESSHILPDREEKRKLVMGGRFHLPHFGFLDVGQLRDHKRLDSFADVVYKTSKKVNALFSEMSARQILQQR